MNIGMVTDTYLPRVNGVAKSIVSFRDRFLQCGHRVVVFAPRYPQPMEGEQDVWRFPAKRVFFSPEDYVPMPWERSLRQGLKQLADLKLDVLHTQTPFTLGWVMLRRARQLGLATVHTYHTLFESYFRHYFPWLPRAMDRPVAAWFSRAFCNRHSGIVAPSTAMEERLRVYGIRVPIAVISTGIDLSPFARVDGPRMRRQLGFKAEDKMLLAMGRVAHEKNIPFLFSVLERLLKRNLNVRLVVAGVGPALESIKIECTQRKLDDRVIFTGLLNRRDWADLYAAADLQVLASVTETQGLVLTESMAAGTPCVAVGAMGVRDVMAGGGGLTTALNEDEFAQAVEKLLTQPVLYTQKVAEATVQAQAWSIERKADTLLEFYQTLIKNRKNKP